MATISVDKRTEVSLSKFLFHTLVLPHTTKGGVQNLRFGHSRTVLGVTRFAGVAGVSEAPFWSRPLGRLCLTHDSNSALERSRARKTSSVRTRGAPVALLFPNCWEGSAGKDAKAPSCLRPGTPLRLRVRLALRTQPSQGKRLRETGARTIHTGTYQFNC